MDFEAAGLLEGLEDKDREARQRLLERLLEDGVEFEELKAAVAEDRLALLPVERVLGGELTAREIEEQTGLAAELVLRLRRLAGLSRAGPDDPVFGQEDVEAAESIKLFLEGGFDKEGVDQITRVMGEAMSRVAATITALFGDAFLEPGDSEEAVAHRFEELAEQMTPALEPVLVATFKAHLRDAVSRGVLSRAELEAGALAGAQELGVCFADVVGFTRLGNEMEVRDLGTIVGRLVQLAHEKAVDPVRLVKTIGDAAMFVSADLPALVDAALSLVDAFEEEGLPALRAGIAVGPAAIRAGDFYGNSVNLASRVTGMARPGSVLCTEAVRDAAPDEFEWSSAGKHRVKGLKESIPLFRARRLGSAESDEKETKRPRAGRRRK